MLLYLALAILAVSAIAGAYVASEAGRPTAEGVIFGLLFGPLGLIVVALLPPVENSRPVGIASRALKVDRSKRDTRTLAGPESLEDRPKDHTGPELREMLDSLRRNRR